MSGLLLLVCVVCSLALAWAVRRFLDAAVEPEGRRAARAPFWLRVVSVSVRSGALPGRLEATREEKEDVR